jgi:hypothetical protein
MVTCWPRSAGKLRETPPVAPVVTGEVEARLIALACSTPPEVANSKIKSGMGALVCPVTGDDPGCLVGLT